MNIRTVMFAGMVLVTLSGCEGWERARAEREAQEQRHQQEMEWMRLENKRAIAAMEAEERRKASVERAKINRPVKIVGLGVALLGMIWGGFLAFRYFMARTQAEMIIAALPYLDPGKQQEVAQALLNGPHGPALLRHLE